MRKRFARKVFFQEAFRDEDKSGLFNLKKRGIQQIRRIWKNCVDGRNLVKHVDMEQNSLKEVDRTVVLKQTLI